MLVNKEIKKFNIEQVMLEVVSAKSQIGTKPRPYTET